MTARSRYSLSNCKSSRRQHGRPGVRPISSCLWGFQWGYSTTRIRAADRGAPPFRLAIDRGLALFAFVAATIIAVTPCVAQVELTPFAGEYRPNGTFASIPAVICLPIYGGPPCSSGGAVQQAGAAIGGVRLAVWVGRRVAVEGAVGYSPSGTVTTFTTGPTFPPPGGFSCSQNGCTSMVTGSGYMLTASARILFALVPRHARGRFALRYRTGPRCREREWLWL